MSTEQTTNEAETSGGSELNIVLDGCKKCGSKAEPQSFYTPGAGLMLDLDTDDRDFENHSGYRELSIAMWAHVCRDCGHVIAKGFDA